MTREEHIGQIMKSRSSLFYLVAQAPDKVLRALLLKKEATPYLRDLVCNTLLARIQCGKELLRGE